LRQTLAEAPIHADSLQRNLQRCDLEKCKGMCCYDGIYLSDEEARIIRGLASSEGAYFRTIGLNLPENVVVHGSWEGQVAGPKTAVAPWPGARLVEDFPSWFHDTTCVFHLPDGRCGLQLLSEERGKHPWHYKPTGCWMHPLTAFYGDEPGLGLEDEHSDPCRLAHYDGFIARTGCGRTAPQGQAAREVLREELDFMGRIVRRDLYAEAGGPSRRVALEVLAGWEKPG
jgi:hypothetical protein